MKTLSLYHTDCENIHVDLKYYIDLATKHDIFVRVFLQKKQTTKCETFKGVNFIDRNFAVFLFRDHP